MITKPMWWYLCTYIVCENCDSMVLTNSSNLCSFQLPVVLMVSAVPEDICVKYISQVAKCIVSHHVKLIMEDVQVINYVH